MVLEEAFGCEISDEEAEKITTIQLVEVERSFSLAKRCYGPGLIRTKLDATTRSSISLSIIAMNADRLTAFNFCDFLKSIFQGALGGNVYFQPFKSVIE